MNGFNFKNKTLFLSFAATVSLPPEMGEIWDKILYQNGIVGTVHVVLKCHATGLSTSLFLTE